MTHLTKQNPKGLRDPGLLPQHFYNQNFPKAKTGNMTPVHVLDSFCDHTFHLI